MSQENEEVSRNELAYRLGSSKAIEKIASDPNIPEDVRNFLANKLEPLDHALISASRSQ